MRSLIQTCARLLFVVLGLSLLIAVAVAEAAHVTFNFQGEVTDLVTDEGPSSSRLIEALFTGTDRSVKGSIGYEAESVSAPVPGASSSGAQLLTITSLNINVGNFEASLGNSGFNFIKIDHTLSVNLDKYQMVAPITFLPPQNGAPLDYFPHDFELTFLHTPGVFGSNSVPSLSGAFSTTFRLGFQRLDPNGGFDSPQISGPALLSAVPLPPAAILFGAGLVALVGLGAGRWRQRNGGLA